MSAVPAPDPSEQSVLERAIARLGRDGTRELLSRVRLGDYIPDIDPELAGASALQFADWIWPLNARPSQRMPTRDFRVWLLRCGRGFGKNRSGAEATNAVAREAAGLIQRGKLRREEARILLVGRSADDTNNNMILGPSGIIARSAPWFRAKPGSRRVVWPGGVEALAFSAAEPDQVRGQNAIFAWCDETASWGPRLEELWANIEMAVRLGPNPRIIATTTPRPLKWLRELIARPGTIDVCRPTSDNVRHLSPGVVADLYAQYGGGWIGQQELNGQILDEGGSSFFPRGDVQLVPEPTDIVKVVRAWDLAATVPSPANRDPDWTFGVKMGRRANGRTVVMHAVGVRKRPGDVEDLMRRCAEQDGRRCPIVLPQDPGQAGVHQVGDLVRKLAGYTVNHERPTGSKETRALPLSSQWQHHNIDVVDGPWNEAYLAQMELFPMKGAHDDAADASASAFNFLAAARRSAFDVPW